MTTIQEKYPCWVPFYIFLLFIIEIDVHSLLVITDGNILLNFSVQARSEENFLIITQNFVCC